MSKILSKEEAEKIIKMMLEPMGFTVPILIFDPNAESNETHKACNSNTVTKKTGSLWWKKTHQVNQLDPVWSGWCWEEVLEKADKWIKTRASPRVDLAERFRTEYAEKEATKALDDELRK